MSAVALARAGDFGFSVVPLLRAMMVPTDYGNIDVAPDVNVNGVNAFLNTLSLNLTYDVNTTPVAGTFLGSGGLTVGTYSDVVPFSTGMYLSLPQESHESVWHMGFVAANSAVAVGIGGYANLAAVAPQLRGFDMRYHYVGPTYVVSAITASNDANYYRLTYVGELALPRVGYGAGINIQPDLVQNYSKVRAFASDFKISSTTLSGSNFNLAGTFSSGVIADTRFISQILGSNGDLRAYPSAALFQQSVSKHEDLRQSSVAKGAIDLMGPDYPRRWCAVDQDATDSIESEWKTADFACAATVMASQTLTTAATVGAFHISQLWVTTTNTELFVSNRSGAPNAAPLPWNKISYGAINEDGALDIDVDVRVSLAAANNGSMLDLGVIDILANFVHVFAYIGTDGLVRYNLQSEVKKQNLSTQQNFITLNMHNNGVAGPTSFTNATQNANQPWMTFSARPRMVRSGFATPTGGKYLGTLVQLSAAVSVGTTNALANTYVIYGYPGRLRMRARNVMAPGRVGPAHIIRYDGVSVGQQLNFTGTTIVQGQAQGSIAPFINTNGQTLTVPDSLFAKFVDLLWTSSPRYKRITTLENYDRVVKPYFTSLTSRDLIASLDHLDVETGHAARAMGVAGGWIPNAGGPVGRDDLSGGMRSRLIGAAGAQYAQVDDGKGASYIDFGSSGGPRRPRSD